MPVPSVPYWTTGSGMASKVGQRPPSTDTERTSNRRSVLPSVRSRWTSWERRIWTPSTPTSPVRNDPGNGHHHHRVISAALRQAEKWGMVPVSVARNATPPRVPVKALTIPPPERVRMLIDAAAVSRTPEMSSIIMIAALTGMRRGELAGLRWADIDWEGSSLTVHRSVWQTSKGWVTKDPKTHQVRRLVLGEVAMKVLASRKLRVDNAVALAEIDLAEDAYVFSDALDGARPVMPNTLTNRFRNLCRTMEAPAIEVAVGEGRDLRPDSGGRTGYTTSGTTRRPN